MTSATPRAANDIRALTSLRGIAAWWVVLYHVRGSLVPHAPDVVIELLAKGYLAVDMFFVLSGFVMMLSYADRLEPTVASCTDFFIRRIARIYPLHLLMLLLTAAYFGLGVLRGGDMKAGNNAVSFVANLLLIHNWGFLEGLSWNFPSWSISTELFAYLVFPPLILAFSWRQAPTWRVVGLILVTTLVIHLAFWIQGHNALGEDISGMGLLRCVAQFFIGMLLCILYQRTRDTAAAPQLAILLSISAVVIASGVVAGGWPETLMLPLLWVCVILSLALWTVRNPLSWRPLVIIGDWSYATYLSHILLWRLFKLVFVDEGRPTPLPILFGFFLVVLVASALLYRWFELPAQQWVRSLASISRSRRST